ncbi:insulin-like 3 (Leydig cell) [Cynoglossus semilaevis]|uniref:insulin-like 3 (Leydig cell) n=1 Tax=Cynoglossus semilaevis TaxID=244447 RepID=UPI0004951E68|nr:relaxin-3-like [Cynoglossus semilaevis]
MSAAKRLPLTLILILWAAVCVVHTQDIKMCGRELVRLAVSTCGNSRLRRSVLDKDLAPYQLTPNLDEVSTEEAAGASEMIQLSSETDEDADVPSLVPHWYPVSPRIRRASGRISDICCEKGCSMRELIQIC